MAKTSSGLSLSVKLNLLAGGVILAVGVAISAAAVLKIDRLTEILGERLMTAELAALTEKLQEQMEVLVASGVSEVPSYIRASQHEFISRMSFYRLGESGRLIVVSDQGVLVVASQDLKADDFLQREVKTVLGASKPLTSATVAGQPSRLAVGRFAPWRWNLILVVPEHELHAERNAFLVLVLLILATSVATGGLLFAWVAWRVVRPIQELSRRLSSVAENPLQVALQVKSTSREVAELQNSFEAMLHGLQAADAEKKKAEEVIWRQANFDGLTNLPNRRLLQDRVEQAIKVANRTHRSFALLFLDLDHFKDVNDTLGHDQGDLLLVEASLRITSCIRQTDTLARLGGDEFTVILTDVEDRQAIDRITQNILEALSQPVQLSTDVVYVSASIGVTIYPDDAKTHDGLLRSADQAMFMAKGDGRNCSRYYTSNLKDIAASRMHLINDLRHAVTKQEFSLHYQPIIDMKTGQVHKAEALLRWQHPVRGWVSPLDFIPAAEETGLINKIGDWVFKEASRQVAQIREDCDPLFKLSVNLSPVQLMSGQGLTEEWTRFMRELALPGAAVTLEITEGVLMHTDRGVLEQLARLRSMGIQIALDDFGTGYSSLSYLRRFSIDFLKIDKSFVNALEVNDSDRACCEAIIVMAHKLGISVVAEGIENQSQRDLLKQMGCDFGQGYFFSKPLPQAGFLAYIQKANQAIAPVVV